LINTLQDSGKSLRRQYDIQFLGYYFHRLFNSIPNLSLVPASSNPHSAFVLPSSMILLGEPHEIGMLLNLILQARLASIDFGWPILPSMNPHHNFQRRCREEAFTHIQCNLLHARMNDVRLAIQ